MAIGAVLLVIAILIVAIWFLFGFKRIKHKFFAIFLIALILFSFFTFNFAFKGKEISVNNISDFANVFKTYFSWLGTAFGNLNYLTSNAVKMDWQGNRTT